jgi:hypothetical protein
VQDGCFLPESALYLQGHDLASHVIIVTDEGVGQPRSHRMAPDRALVGQ